MQTVGQLCWNHGLYHDPVFYKMEEVANVILGTRVRHVLCSRVRREMMFREDEESGRLEEVVWRSAGDHGLACPWAWVELEAGFC